MRKLASLLIIILGLISWTSIPKEARIAINNFSLPTQEDDFVYDFVDDMPQFPGGNDALYKYIQDNLKYPQEAKDNKVVEESKKEIKEEPEAPKKSARQRLKDKGHL